MSDDKLDISIDRPLYEYCRNATNREGDTFVGLKSELIDEKHCLSIHFPIGYEISQDENEVRNEIVNLISVLQEYNDEQSRVSKVSKEQLLKTVRFPVQAFLIVIVEYINNGPYQIKEEEYISANSGSVNWSRTLKKEKPFVTKKGIIYPKYRVRHHNNSDKDLITEINKYCAYQSYLKLGWIYKLPPFPKPSRTRENSVYRSYLQSEFLKSNNDNEKQLFTAMIDILDFTNNSSDPEEFYFGTNNFEYIWEKLIESVYGNERKERYFPKTKWLLNIGSNRENTALEPDTIMKYEKNIYVLDAKYYKYGITKIARDLPSSSSINKQITYAEFIATNEKFKAERDDGIKIYNAFLLPYNHLHKPYNKLDSNYYAIGEAVAEWKESNEDYERVQGILVDIKMVMNNTIKPNENEIINLSNKIVESLNKNKGLI